MTHPFFANRTRVEQAFEAFVLPGIRHAMAQKLLKRQSLTIIVVNPVIQYAQFMELPILFKYSIGEQEPFLENAIGKAMISWRTGLPSGEVVMRHQHLLRKGDCRFPGSAVMRGMIAAASGADPEHDEMFSEMTLSALWAQAAIATRHFLAQEDPPRFLG